jgi:NADPH:quinone reductase-like Zn-dependent oxidoreductase
MRAMRAEGFSGYKDLKLVDIPKPAVSDGRVLVRITAGGVTPLEDTILSGSTQMCPSLDRRSSNFKRESVEEVMESCAVCCT